MIFRSEQYDENFAVVEMQQSKVRLSRPRYLGLVILNLAKFQMYKFHYGIMGRLFKQENLRLLVTDTDSLCYEISQPAHTTYKDIWETLYNDEDNMMVCLYLI